MFRKEQQIYLSLLCFFPVVIFFVMVVFVVTVFLFDLVVFVVTVFLFDLVVFVVIIAVITITIIKTIIILYSIVEHHLMVGKHTKGCAMNGKHRQTNTNTGLRDLSEKHVN